MSRSKHVYADGVTVEILNLGSDESAVTPEMRSYNGSRVFYKTINDEKVVLCRFPGYSIEKHVVATNIHETTPEDTTSGLGQVLETQSPGTLCLTNDGPLLMVFKIDGSVRLHMMRSANHGFDQQFIQAFAEQYEAKFDYLFPASMATSPWCYLFRQGDRSSAMSAPMDGNSRTLLYLGGLECNMVSTMETTESTSSPILSLSVLAITSENAVSILRNPELGLVCYRHPGGEVQILSEGYLQRVAVTTGFTMNELIEGVDRNQDATDDFLTRPSSLMRVDKFSAKLTSSRFPRVLDLFSLYVLCGTNSGRKLATVSGFSVRLSPGGRILANPKRGFYNFCRAAGVNPRHELAFPATPSSMRLAIRRIILSSTLQSRVGDVEKQFDDYENALVHLAPMLVMRALGGSAALSHAFEAAFGITACDLVSSLPIELNHRLQLRSVRSALLLSDHYKMVTIGRFALRHLLDAEFTPSAMRESQLVSILSEYSHSSRRRRLVADGVNPEP